MALIFPSLISADLLNLEKEILQLDPYCSGYHLDVMDYHFVQNLTWGPAFLQAIAHKTSRQLWVHLMVDNPQLWIQNLNLPVQTILSFHIETTQNPQDVLFAIQKKKWMTSIAISPKTALEEILPFLPMVNQILIMSVNPGQSGQQFMENTIDKVKVLAGYRQANDLNFKIAMDGGISQKNIQKLTQIGVDHFAIAHAIFNDPHPVKALQELNKLAQ